MSTGFRCRWFDPSGRPIKGGCQVRVPPRCPWIHPDDEEWSTSTHRYRPNVKNVGTASLDPIRLPDTEDEYEVNENDEGGESREKSEDFVKDKSGGNRRGQRNVNESANAGWGGGGAAWGTGANAETNQGTWGMAADGGGGWGGESGGWGSGDDSGGGQNEAWGGGGWGGGGDLEGTKSGEANRNEAWGGRGWGGSNDAVGGHGGTNSSGWGGGTSTGVSAGETAVGAATIAGQGMGARGRGGTGKDSLVEADGTGGWESAFEDERRSSVVEGGRSNSGTVRGGNRGSRGGVNGRGRGRGRGWSGGHSRATAITGPATGGRSGAPNPAPPKITQGVSPSAGDRVAPATPTWGNVGSGSWGAADACHGAWGGAQTAETSPESGGGWGGGGWGSPMANPKSNLAQAASTPPNNTHYDPSNLPNTSGATPHSVDVDENMDTEHIAPLRTPPPSANLPSKPGFNAFTPSPVQDKGDSRAPVLRGIWNSSGSPPTQPRSFTGVPSHPRSVSGTPTGPRLNRPSLPPNYFMAATVEKTTPRGGAEGVWEQPRVGGHIVQAGFGGGGGEGLSGAGGVAGTGVNAGVQDDGWGYRRRSALQGGMIQEKPTHPDSPIDDAPWSGQRGLPYDATQDVDFTDTGVSIQMDAEDGFGEMNPGQRPIPIAYSPDLSREESQSGSQDVEMDESEVVALLELGVDDMDQTASVKSFPILVDAHSGEEKMAAYGEGLRLLSSAISSHLALRSAEGQLSQHHHFLDLQSETDDITISNEERASRMTALNAEVQRLRRSLDGCISDLAHRALITEGLENGEADKDVNVIHEFLECIGKDIGGLRDDVQSAIELHESRTQKAPKPKIILSENATNHFDDLIVSKVTSRLDGIKSATSNIVSSSQESSDARLVLDELRARLGVMEQSQAVMKMKKALLSEQLTALKQNRKLEAENAKLQQRISELESGSTEILQSSAETTNLLSKTTNLLYDTQQKMDALSPPSSTSQPELSADLPISIENHITQIVRRQHSSILKMLEDDVDAQHISVEEELWSMIQPMVRLGQRFRPWLKMSIEKTEEPFWNEGFKDRIMSMLVKSE